MLGPDTEPDVMESLVSGPSDDDEPDDMIDPDDLPDPEPIPQVFTSSDDDDDEAEGGGRGLIFAAAGVGLVALLFAGLFFARLPIAALVPGAASLYAMVGLSVSTLGAGLDIRNVTSKRSTEQGNDVLVVRGIIINVSDEPRAVPFIRVVLLDAGEEEVQVSTVKPVKAEIPPGDNIGFRARMENPAGTARRLEVTFTEQMAPGSEMKGPAEGKLRAPLEGEMKTPPEGEMKTPPEGEMKTPAEGKQGS